MYNVGLLGREGSSFEEYALSTGLGAGLGFGAGSASQAIARRMAGRVRLVQTNGVNSSLDKIVVIGRHDASPFARPLSELSVESHHGVWGKWVEVFAKTQGIRIPKTRLRNKAPTLFASKGAGAVPGPTSMHNATRGYLPSVRARSGRPSSEFWSQMTEREARHHAKVMMEMLGMNKQQRGVYWRLWNDYFNRIKAGRL